MILKKNKLSIVVFLSVSVLLMFNLYNSSILVNATLIPHESISITEDAGFDTYGFPGTGDSSDPYIIENYEIITGDEYGIYITGTTMSFIIRNCYVDASWSGIFIHNVLVILE